MIRRVDHISIAVKDLDKAREFFIGVLGGKELYSAPVPEQKFRWTTIELGTSCFVELIDAPEKDGFVHRFLETRGEGPHHVTIQVDDLDAICRVLEEKGIPTFGRGEPFPRWKEVYIHPKNAFGTLIQFAEFDPLDWINPGYIPPSYAEFAPAEKVGEGEVEVRKITAGGRAGVEIRRGVEAIRVPLSSVENLISALKKL
ncbi:MAG TPA: VOC family protein [Thermodesulfobacteriota bacterium]|nr:VOC family protein [Thermodesulfobacteriota bacterium]